MNLLQSLFLLISLVPFSRQDDDEIVKNKQEKEKRNEGFQVLPSGDYVERWKAWTTKNPSPIFLRVRMRVKGNGRGFWRGLSSGWGRCHRWP